MQNLCHLFIYRNAETWEFVHHKPAGSRVFFSRYEKSFCLAGIFGRRKRFLENFFVFFFGF